MVKNIHECHEFLLYLLAKLRKVVEFTMAVFNVQAITLLDLFLG